MKGTLARFVSRGVENSLPFAARARGSRGDFASRNAPPGKFISSLLSLEISLSVSPVKSAVVSFICRA